MADILKTISNPHGNLVFRETAATSTFVDNIFAKTAPKIYVIKLDNSANSTEAVYLKIFAAGGATSSGITLGTDQPFLVCKARAGATTEVYIPGGIILPTGDYAHMAVVTTAGTAGTTSPTGTVQVTLIGE
tara:strand:- start:1561 stop:1953 length:393 start_codon:yes stop_codon:yes gene_type:complete